MKADKKEVLRLLKTARGQIDGIIKMVEEDKYCIDIVHQIMASEAVLRKTSKVVLQGHLEGCVSDAFESGVERDEKINEIIEVFDKLNR